MSSYDRYKKSEIGAYDMRLYPSAEDFERCVKIGCMNEVTVRRIFELIDCLDYDDRKGKLDPLTKHRKDQLKEALKNER